MYKKIYNASSYSLSSHEFAPVCLTKKIL